MKKNRGNKVKIEFDEITLWKLGTIIFGILFVLSHFSGNGGSVSDDSGAAIPSAPQAAPQAPSPVDVEIGDAYVKGNKNAKVTIIEYSDFECPFCKKFHTTPPEIVAHYKGKVNWVYRHLPLAFHNPGAQKQAEASECANEVGGNESFWKYADLIYLRTKSNGKGFPLKNLVPLAVEIGLNEEQFKTCLNSGKYAKRIQKDLDDAMKMGISGTPSIVIKNNETGDIRFKSGAYPAETFIAEIEKLLN